MINPIIWIAENVIMIIVKSNIFCHFLLFKFKSYILTIMKIDKATDQANRAKINKQVNLQSILFKLSIFYLCFYFL